MLKIPLLLLKSERASRVFGVEIQKEGAALAALNAEKNAPTIVSAFDKVLIKLTNAGVTMVINGINAVAKLFFN